MHLIPEGEQRHILDGGCGCGPERMDLVAGQDVRPALYHRPSGELEQVLGVRPVTREVLRRAGYSERQVTEILDRRTDLPEQVGDEHDLTWTNVLRDGCAGDELAAAGPPGGYLR
jgi:hypothetical protein